MHGRKLPYTLIAFRNCKSPPSGPSRPRRTPSHFGPPTAANKTASASNAACFTKSVRGVPWASMLHPPISSVRRAKVRVCEEKTERTLTASAVISGPIPSPGRTRTLWVTISGCVYGGYIYILVVPALGKGGWGEGQ
ncbi:hypothetical protein I7I48_02150 [Histoplasma ohiense]|nr:hypothetical protein I7I48_02150 [Histoplasma ohiense (nom. inval.)]